MYGDKQLETRQNNTVDDSQKSSVVTKSSENRGYKQTLQKCRQHPSCKSKGQHDDTIRTCNGRAIEDLLDVHIKQIHVQTNPLDCTELCGGDLTKISI